MDDDDDYHSSSSPYFLDTFHGEIAIPKSSAESRIPEGYLTNVMSIGRSWRHVAIEFKTGMVLDGYYCFNNFGKVDFSYLDFAYKIDKGDNAHLEYWSKGRNCYGIINIIKYPEVWIVHLHYPYNDGKIVYCDFL